MLGQKYNTRKKENIEKLAIRGQKVLEIPNLPTSLALFNNIVSIALCNY
jgi:hypothetical protein